MPTSTRFSLLFLLPAAMYSLHAQDMSATQKKLEAEYALTQATADNTDIVTAGSILTLKSGRLVMVPSTSSMNCSNHVKNGKVQASGGCKVSTFHLPIPGAPGNPNTSRTFVPGEKMWVTKIEVRSNEVIFDLFTDAISDVRYKSTVHFPLPGGLNLTPDQVLEMVQQIFTAQPPEANDKDAKDQGGQGGQQGGQGGGPQQAAANQAQASAPASAAPAAAPAAAPTAVVVPPPPPPPTDQPPAPPKTIEKGQTTDQVVASFGQPKKVVKLGTKQIYYYDDMKVIFVAGKVSDIQ